MMWIHISFFRCFLPFLGYVEGVGGLCLNIFPNWFNVSAL